MDSHKAKVQVVRSLTNDLRRAILGDMENLRFELLGKELISPEACKHEKAGDMVSEIQYRLDGEEAIWDKLIEVLDKCNKKQLTENLSKQLAIEMGQEGSSTARGAASKFEKLNKKFWWAWSNFRCSDAKSKKGND